MQVMGAVHLLHLALIGTRSDIAEALQHRLRAREAVRGIKSLR